MAERPVWTVYDEQGNPRAYVAPPLPPADPTPAQAMLDDVLHSGKCIAIAMLAFVAFIFLLTVL